MSSSPPSPKSNQTTERERLDTNRIAYRNSLRELAIMIAIWGVALVWTIGYCSFAGYRDAETEGGITTTFGFPTWVFWGVILPWVLCGIISVFFALFGIAEDDDDVNEEAIVAGELQ